MDPYKVLGISPNATDDEIKTQYRKLSRMYHPDANVGKPNQAELEEKFKEVQQAYNTIMDQRQGKTTQSSYNYGGGYGFYGNQQTNTGSSDDDNYLRSAANYIQNGYYREGLTALENVKQKTAYWYYLHAFGNYRLGNNVIAQQSIQTACDMEPNNMYYRSLQSEIMGGGARYQQHSGQYGGNPMSWKLNNRWPLCLTLIALNLCCGGGGGYFIPILCC